MLFSPRTLVHTDHCIISCFLQWHWQLMLPRASNERVLIHFHLWWTLSNCHRTCEFCHSVLNVFIICFGHCWFWKHIFCSDQTYDQYWPDDCRAPHLCLQRFKHQTYQVYSSFETPIFVLDIEILYVCFFSSVRMVFDDCEVPKNKIQSTAMSIKTEDNVQRSKLRKT